MLIKTMPKIIHLCVDPLRVFCDASYNPEPSKKPRIGLGRGNTDTEAAVDGIVKMITEFNALGIKTYWSYMEQDIACNLPPLGPHESGGGFHPKIVRAFPDFVDSAVPKYSQSAFSNFKMTQIITSEAPDIVIGSGFLASECLTDTLTDVNAWYNSSATRYVAEDCIADNDETDPPLEETLAKLEKYDVKRIASKNIHCLLS